MAKLVSEITLGIDVSKDELVIYDWDTEQLSTLVNEPAEIKTFLGRLYGPVRVAIEPTSNYHLELVEQVHALGLTVYMINPRQLVHYRKAVGERNKTDPADAWLLARYLHRESASLRPFKPQCAKAQRLWALGLARTHFDVEGVGRECGDLAFEDPARAAQRQARCRARAKALTAALLAAVP